MSPEEILREVRRFSTAPSENDEVLVASGTLDSTAFERWRTIMGTAADLGMVIGVRSAAGDDDLTLDLFEGGAAIESRLSIGKPISPGSRHFFTIDALSRFLEADDRSASVVYTAEQQHEFASVSCRFRPWTEPTTDTIVAAREPGPDPARFVRDFTRDKIVPRSIIERITLNAPANRDDPAWIAWRRSSIWSIALSLASEVEDSNGIRLVFKAMRPTRVALTASDFEDEEAVLSASEALARWIFLDGNDYETRHVIASSALAQEWSDDVTWSHGVATFGPRALEAASSAYALHLSGKVDDALKALADLRKALYDEVPKTLQQSRDLASGLWRDLAIALAAVIARLAIRDQSNAAASVYAVALYALAAYVLLSGIVALALNGAFRGIERRSREHWLERLYGFLGRQEREQLATTPFQEASAAYARTAWVVGGLYALVVIGILIIAHSPSLLVPVPTAAPSPTVSPARSHASPVARNHRVPTRPRPTRS